ncbi:MAG: 3'-5' exonuclease [Candidatus Omnitrophota bacterium]
MNIKNTEFVVFDVETTGLSAQDGDRIVEIAALKIKNGQVVDKFYSLVNPKRSIPSQATRINNITDDMLTEAPTAQEVLPKMVSFIAGACVAGHNVRFDLGFLSYELALMGRKFNESTPAVDTLKMAKDLLPYLSNYRLGYLARSLGVTVSETHRAMADVELTVQVLIRMMDMATDKDLDNVSKFISQFSVEKPSFKLTSTPQASLF